MRKKSEEYKRNTFLNENVINKINGMLAVGICGFLSLLFFGFILFTILVINKSNSPMGTKFLCITFGFFIFMWIMTIFCSLSFDRDLKEIEKKVSEYKDIFSWNKYSSLMGLNKAFYIIYFIFMGIIIISSIALIILKILNNKFGKFYYRV